MPSAELRPHTNANFLVDLGYGDARSASGGFCEVIFPEFRVGSAGQTAATPLETSSGRQEATALLQRLILRRGVTGARDLYLWWDKARRGKAPLQRTVKVQLLAADHSTVVLTWSFRQARPMSLSYSPLNAMQATTMIETIELEFASVEVR